MTDNECEELLLKTKPILFNTEMVRAILDGRKTVTRRVLKPQPEKAHNIMDYDNDAHTVDFHCGNCTPNGTFIDWTKTVKAPYWYGDILYVKETWKSFCGMLYGRENGTYIPLDDFEGYQYKADEQCICTKGINPFCDGFDDQKRDISFDDKWHPSIHMPKEAARIFLRVTDVRVERLQDITPEQIDAEGCKEYAYSAKTGELLPSKPTWFKMIWDSTIKKSDIAKYGWAANPYVWVIEFERID